MESQPYDEPAEPEAPGQAPLAFDDEAPPAKPMSGNTLFLEENWDELRKELGHLPDDEFKVEVKKRFKALPKEERQQFRNQAKEQKQHYYDQLETYLVTHPSYQVS